MSERPYDEGHGETWLIGGQPVHFDVGGETIEIEVGGKTWAFCWDRWCGPVAMNKRTDSELKNQPGPRSPFWIAVQAWHDQGSKHKDGKAIYEMPKPEPSPREKAIHLAGNQYLVRHPEKGSDYEQVKAVVGEKRANQWLEQHPDREAALAHPAPETP